MSGAIYYETRPDGCGATNSGFEVDPKSTETAHLWCGRGIGPQSWPDGYGRLPRHPYQFTETYETPRLLMTPRKKQRPPIDCEFWGGMWFISQRFKNMIEEIDLGACDIRPAQTIMPDGSAGPEYWICSVTRMLESKNIVDVENSKNLKIVQLPTGSIAYRIDSIEHLRLINVEHKYHLFRIMEFSDRIFCSNDLKIKITEAKLTGIGFTKLGRR